MATPSEKLAESLRFLKAAQDRGQVVFQSTDLPRSDRERLVATGFLSNVVKGWYIVSRPGENEGDSTSWYASFFDFVSAYCIARFSDAWYLSPELSIRLHAGETTIPRQITVCTKDGSNNNLSLKFETSLFDLRVKDADFASKGDIVVRQGLRLLSLPAALVRATPNLYTTMPVEMQIALSGIRDVSDVLGKLLEGGHSVIAGRIAGAMRAIDRPEDADAIIKTMRSAGYVVNESNPFQDAVALPPLVFHDRPCVNRIRLMWQTMRETVLQAFPPPPGVPADLNSYIADLNDRHVQDAYHSLSIEGYRVSEALIEKIVSGNWDPTGNDHDENDRNALAAKGYNQAFQRVRESVIAILKSGNAGEVVRRDYRDWYAQLFEPSVRAGIIEARHLAGYRTTAVFIKNSRHVPPAQESVRDAMPALFELLKEEQEASVRAVLGHFVFVYIHPYMDGNGRMGRFLMNAMLASGGYPWTVIKVDDRGKYMTALEVASTKGDIGPFADFIGQCVKKQMDAISTVHTGTN